MKTKEIPIFNAQDFHIKKLEELKYKPEAIEDIVSEFIVKGKYDFAESYHQAMREQEMNDQRYNDMMIDKAFKDRNYHERQFIKYIWSEIKKRLFMDH